MKRYFLLVGVILALALTFGCTKSPTGGNEEEKKPGEEDGAAKTSAITTAGVDLFTLSVDNEPENVFNVS